MLNFDVDTKITPSPCVECGHVMDAAAGDRVPEPGDFTLCIACACLNVFSDELTLRVPTLDEYLEAAADSELQALRRAIEHVDLFNKNKRSEDRNP